MVVVVAAEAAGEVHVPEVVRVAAPRDLHRREDVPVVDRHESLPRPYDVIMTRAVNRRLALFVELVEPGHNRGVGLLLGRRGTFEQLRSLFLDERQRRGDFPGGHGLVHRFVRHGKRVRRPVVAIHAVHQTRLHVLQRLGLEIHGRDALGFPKLPQTRQKFPAPLPAPAARTYLNISQR